MVRVTIKYMPHDGKCIIIPGSNWSKHNIYIFGSLASKIGKVATECPAGNKPFKRRKKKRKSQHKNNTTCHYDKGYRKNEQALVMYIS